MRIRKTSSRRDSRGGDNLPWHDGDRMTLMVCSCEMSDLSQSGPANRRDGQEYPFHFYSEAVAATAYTYANERTARKLG